ncbi:MAG: nucleotidyltransferase domain-containing protein [Deltaproteobacteria bacterium]|nr:nucleotidyltransferase domain-containing protein [Deltaproteobacteria bacterium]
MPNRADTAREQEILEKALRLLIKELTPKRVYLFGSRAKNKALTNSDFDFALDCEPPDMATRRVMKEKLEDIAGLYTVDVVFLSEVEPGFRDLVVQTGKVLYEQK